MTHDQSITFAITDVHVHLQDKRFGETWDETARYLERARERGVVRCVCAATSPADWNAVDSLSSVGGMFAGGGAGARALDDIASSTAETVKVLKNIDKNTQGGGATWQ